MKKIIYILFLCLVITSCAVVYGPNLDQLTQSLELGMSKQDAINIMGKDYFIESALQVPEGDVEVLHFRSSYYNEFILYFLNNTLTEFHRYIPPQQNVHVIKEEKK